MKQDSKVLYDKMVDFKRFAVLLLAVGVFFYLGVIIPSETKTGMDLNIMVISSIHFWWSQLYFLFNQKNISQSLTKWKMVKINKRSHYWGRYFFACKTKQMTILLKISKIWFTKYCLWI